MGLLDMFSNLDPNQTQGLLAAASKMMELSGPSLVPRSFGQIAGGAYGAYNGAVNAAQDRQQQQALYDLKLKSMQGDLTDQEQTRQQRQELDAAARDSMQTPEQQALGGGGGPTMANAARIPSMSGGFDMPGFLNRAMRINPLEGLKMAQAFKKSDDEFDPTPRTGTHADGSTFQYLVSKGGKTKVLDDTLPRDEMKLASLGGKDVAYNPYALQPGQTFQHTMSPDGAANNALGYARLNFDKAESAASDQPGTPNETMAKQIAAYKSAPLGQFSLNKPWGQATMDRVLELNPQYDGAQYAPRAAALRAYAPGGKEALGIDSINIGMNHVATLRDLALAQKTGNVQAFNKIANDWATATGQPAPTNLRMAADMVAPEVVKAVSGVAGTGEERAHFAQSLTGNGSYAPDQIIGATNEVQNLFAGRLSAKKQSYTRGTQLDNFDTMLTPAAQKLLQQKPPAPSTTQAPPTRKVATLSDIAATARATGKSTRQVTADLRAAGWDIGGPQ